MENHDARALQVAQQVRQRERPELAILFGSRARGDYREGESDIDIMLVVEAEPGDTGKKPATEAAEAQAQETYGREVPVQLVWRTLETFRHNRRYINSVETAAVREGIVMPRNPNEYSAADYEDEETEYEYNWTNYDNRLRHAELHLNSFQINTELGLDDILIGQQAQQALEHGMKALLEAHGAQYRNVHDIGELLGNIRYNDPDLRDFRLAIEPDVYSEYAGGKEYQETLLQPILTSQEDFLNRTVADAELIVSRAKEVRARQQ